MKKLIILLAATLIAMTAFGQPDPNAPQQQPGNQGQQRGGFDIAAMADNQIKQTETSMELTDAGIFLYKTGKLAKLDYLELAVQKEVELFGPMPTVPAVIAQPAPNGVNPGVILQDLEVQKYITDIAKRLALPTIIPSEGDLYFVIGDSFFKINSLTMEKSLQTNLAKPVDPNQPFQQNIMRLMGNFNMGGNQQAKAPVAKIKDNVMVILKQDEIIVVDLVTGKVGSRNQLPPEFVTVNNQRGMGGPQGQGGFQGQGGGGQRQPPMPPPGN